MIPLLLFLNRTKGHRYTARLLSKLGVDNLLFLNADQRIGARCYPDLLRESIRAGALDVSSLGQMVECARTDLMHGILGPVYKAQKRPLAALQGLVLNSSYYEQNFDYRIESVSDEKLLEVSIAPREHFKQVEYQDADLGDFLCRFKKEYFSTFPMYVGSQPLLLSESECHFKGHSRCIYQLKAA
jgi:hypothetical protein